MRIVFLFLSICLVLAAQDASLQGIVVDSMTHHPLTGAHLTVFGITDSHPEQARGAISRPDGGFAISGLSPGTYYIILQKNGFVYIPPKEMNVGVVLKAGEQRLDLTLPMAPEIAISGRVIDEFGDPIRNATVDAVPLTPEALRDSNSARTDERGQFRILTAPGKYFVRATAPREQTSVVPEVRSDGTQPAVFAATWYPASEARERGAVVDAPAGHDAAGIDIRMVRQRSLSVSGTVSGVTAGGPNAVVYFSQTDNAQQPFFNMRTAVADRDGRFSIVGVGPGNYRSVALFYGGVGSQQLRSQFADVRVDNSDVTVALQLSAPEEMAGSVVFDGTPAAEKRTVALSALTQFEKSFSGQGQAGGGEVDSEGNFKLPAVFPGKARVVLIPLPENAYIKSVKLDSLETQGDTVDLTRGVQGSRLRIMAGLNGARVEGALLEADGQPQKAAVEFVALSISGDDVSFETAKQVSPGAKFTFSGMRPGKYRFYFIDVAKISNGGVVSKEALVDGPEIELHEGDRIVKDIRVPEGKSGAK